MVPAVRIMGIMVNACYTSSLLGAPIHPLLLRRQGKQGDLPNLREAVSVGSLINQAVESQEKKKLPNSSLASSSLVSDWTEDRGQMAFTAMTDV